MFTHYQGMCVLYTCTITTKFPTMQYGEGLEPMRSIYTLLGNVRSIYMYITHYNQYTILVSVAAASLLVGFLRVRRYTDECCFTTFSTLST